MTAASPVRTVITIDPNSGFCFGVVNAIRKAEEQLAGGGELFCLGDIVHNSDEVERLRAKGLATISHENLAQLRDTRVLLRAHGEPPSTYATARARGIDIIDATCPVVLQLQRRIKEAYEQSLAASPDDAPQIVIYGKLGHAEVNGLVGQTDGHAIVIESADGIDRIDPSRDILLYSQTTKSREGFRSLIGEVERHLMPGRTVKAFDTICRQVSNRVNLLREFAAANDVVLFVSGAKSSNGRVLYGQCRTVNPASFPVANASEVDPSWFERPMERIGICGATSTPRWLMEDVALKVAEILRGCPGIEPVIVESKKSDDSL